MFLWIELISICHLLSQPFCSILASAAELKLNFIKQDRQTFSVFPWINLVQKRSKLSKFKMNNLARSAIIPRRCFGTGQALRDEVHPVFKKFKAVQQQYQQDNGLVTHLKAGPRDKANFYLTTVMCFTTIALTAKTWYTMAMKGR